MSRGDTARGAGERRLCASRGVVGLSVALDERRWFEIENVVAGGVNVMLGKDADAVGDVVTTAPGRRGGLSMWTVGVGIITAESEARERDRRDA